MDKRTEEFLNDPIFPLLVKMSAPNTVAFFIQSIVVLAEVWLISKPGTISLAAVTLAYPAVMLTQQMAWGSLGGPLLLLYLEAWELAISQELRDCCGIQYF